MNMSTDDQMQIAASADSHFMSDLELSLLPHLSGRNSIAHHLTTLERESDLPILRQRYFSWRALIAVSFVILLGAACCTVLIIWVHHNEKDAFRQEHRSLCHDRVTFFHYRFNNTVMQHFQDWDAFIYVADTLNSEQIEEYGIASTYDSSVLGVCVFPFVPAEQRSAWEAENNRSIKYLQPISLNDSRSTPVTFIYPRVNSTVETTNVIGIDLSSDDLRRAAINTAELTGSPTATIMSLVTTNQSAIGIWSAPIVRTDSQFVQWDQNMVLIKVYKDINLTKPPLYQQPVKNIKIIAEESLVLPLEIGDYSLGVLCIPTDTSWNRFNTSWGEVTAVVVALIFISIAAFVWRTINKYERSRQDSHLLQESRKLLHTLTTYSKIVVQAVPDPLVMLDSNGYITGLNQHALDQSGYMAEDFTQNRTHISELISFPIGFRFLPSGSWEVFVFRKDGSSYPAQCSVSPMGSTSTFDRVVQVLLFSDITHKKAVLNALRAAEKEARKVNSIKTQLLYFICHELRNPIHVILSASFLLSDLCSKQVMQEHGLPILYASTYMTELLGDIVEYVEQGISGKMLTGLIAQPISTTPEKEIALSTIMNSVVDTLPFTVLQKPTRVELRGCETEDVLIQRDVRQVAKVVAKLLELGVRIATDGSSVQLTSSLIFDQPKSEEDQHTRPENPIQPLNESSSITSAINVQLTLRIQESSTQVPMEVDVFSFKLASQGRDFGGIGIPCAVLYRVVDRFKGTVKVIKGYERQPGFIMGQSIILSLPVSGTIVQPKNHRPDHSMDHQRDQSILMEKISLSMDVEPMKRLLPPLSPPQERRDILPTPIALPKVISERVLPTRPEVAPVNEIMPEVLPTTPAPTNVETRPSIHILLVEDNLIVQRMTKKLLEKRHYKVTTADNGQQAIDKVQQYNFAAVLMDLIMPIKGGYEATEHIRNILGKSCTELPIVALTANALDEERTRCLQDGLFNDFLTKPATADAINHALKKCLPYIQESELLST